MRTVGGEGGGLVVKHTEIHFFVATGPETTCRSTTLSSVPYNGRYYGCVFRSGAVSRGAVLKIVQGFQEVRQRFYATV